MGLIVALFCVALTLIVLGTPAAAKISNLLVVAALFLAICLGVGTLQLARSFWIAMGVVILGLQYLQSTNSNPLGRLASDPNTTIARHLYNALHLQPSDFYNQPVYLLGNRVIKRSQWPSGKWKSDGAMTPGAAEKRGTDVRALPFVAAYDDVEKILQNLIALTGGLLGGWLALAARRRSMTIAEVATQQEI